MTYPRFSIILVLLQLSYAEVEFTHSTLYDQYDIFQPFTTTFNSRCKEGCSVYASLSDDESAIEAAKDVIITDDVDAITLYDIARKYNTDTTQKVSFDFESRGRTLSIHNLNNATGGPVILYVFGNGGRSNIEFEIYDAKKMNRPFSSGRKTITIMSTDPFTIGAEATQLGNTVYAHAAGMDNSIDPNVDKCVKVFELYDQASFPGFVLNVQFPIISFYFNMETPVALYTKMEYSTTTTFNQFLTSPGFVGCYGWQVYRSSLYKDSLEQTIIGDKLQHIHFDATLNTAEPVEIQDLTSNGNYNLVGEGGTVVSADMDTKLVHVKWTRAYTRSAFLLRFTATDIPDSSSSTTTTTAKTTTTSGSEQITQISTLLACIATFWLAF